jgi:hypothetical protein
MGIEAVQPQLSIYLSILYLLNYALNRSDYIASINRAASK